MPTKTPTLLAALFAGAALAMPAHALKINLVDDGTVGGTKAANGFAVAARYWESVLTNDATVNFLVGYDHLGPTVLGGTRSATVNYYPIADYETKLAATGTSALDAVVAANLPALSSTGSVTTIVPAYYDKANQQGVASTGTRTAPDGMPISQSIALSSANFKALYGGGESVIDAQIQFSSDFGFDFNPTDGVAASRYDFIGVAVHEMGHALGFLSASDDFDYSTVTAGLTDDDEAFDTDAYWWGYAADLFRYTGSGELNWAFDQPAYFSIDGGATAFNNADYSTGEINGDGWQGSHWKAPINGDGNFTCGLPFEGILNPYTCNGMTDAVTGSDLAFFDAIGWNTTIDALGNPDYHRTTAQMFKSLGGVVPEPATWGTMLIGFGAVGAIARRRRKTAAA